MDNMPAFEYGALEQTRDLALIMRKEFDRSQSQSAADKDLSEAQSKLNIDPHELVSARVPKANTAPLNCWSCTVLAWWT